LSGSDEKAEGIIYTDYTLELAHFLVINNLLKDQATTSTGINCCSKSAGISCHNSSWYL